MNKQRSIAGASLFVPGIGIVVAGAMNDHVTWFLLGVVLLTVGAFVFAELKFNIEGGGLKIAVGDSYRDKYLKKREHELRETAQMLDAAKQRKELPPEQIAQKLAYQRGKSIPGAAAPPLSPATLALASDLLIRPSAYPMTPMYMLDQYYRIIDWNLAFTLAFDGTMEGLLGHSVLEWTYWLVNFKQVFDHGSEVFNDSADLPIIDKENLEFDSSRYGLIRAVKRAYQIPDDNGQCLAWLTTLEMKFAGPSIEEKYRGELVRVLGLDQLWTEYAASYDPVLLATKVYPELINLIVGNGTGAPTPEELAPDAIILDLGAGTGNITKLLVEKSPKRTVFAVEQNRAMLDILKTKCSRFLSDDKNGPGVIIIRQNIASLYGFEEECCDCVIINNVLYSLDAYQVCLEEVFRVLRPGGELRISEPTAHTSLDVLFTVITKELKESGKYAELEADFLRVKEINYSRLRPMLNRWTIEDLKGVLLRIGFSKIKYELNDVYAGQSLLIFAQK
jgi:ubiquinone/menaquinone biosynthesis C-methylase UbiE